MTDISALDAQVLSAFLRIDELIASEVQRGRCPTCDGPLDAAHFVRKPHLAGVTLDDSICLRFSFCCRVDGCRRRQTPPSVRFAGLVRAHTASIALALEGGANAPRRARLRLSQALGVGGNARLMTNDLVHAVADHSQGNVRALMNLGGKFLQMGMRRERATLDVDLLLEMLGDWEPKPGSRGRAAR